MEDVTKQVDFEVLGEAGNFIAVNKRAGLLVHPTKPGGPRTLLHGLRELLAFEIANGGQVSLINRLDRETSGVVLVAKTATAAREAAMAMAAGKIWKSYRTLVFGWPTHDEFTVDAPIIRQGEIGTTRIYLKRCIHADGACATTKFRVVERCVHPQRGKFAVVDAHPFTGRTHQIRLHLAHVGHWVLGDKIYGPDETWYLRFIEEGWISEMDAALWLNRHALHSRELAFESHGTMLRWTAPIPTDLQLDGSDRTPRDSKQIS